jgi:hypothetical protein
VVMRKALISVVVICLVAAVSFALGSQPVNKVADDKDTEDKKDKNVVGIYIESFQRQIDIRDLQKRYPGESAQRINPESLKADAIVGWYDKGSSYHEQKMQNNLKSLGGIQILPETLRGTALRGEVHK